MLHSHSLCAGAALLALVLAACTSAPPGPLLQDHPASPTAPAAPLQAEPSALATYRDFGAAASIPRTDEPAVDHSMHKRHEHGGAASAQDDQEGAHADHQ